MDELVLGDLITLKRGTTYDSRLLDSPGPVLLGLASIQRDGGFRSDSLRAFGGHSPENLLMRPGDIYVSLKDVTQSGDLLGAVSRVPAEVPIGRLTQDTVALRFTTNDVSPSFVYWWLRTPQYRSYCRARAIGTTNLSLSRKDFLSFPISLPSKLQSRMVTILEAIEKKIELNRKMSATLEAMARAIFKSWFVDFDPVRAKSEGRRPEGMDEATAALFPDRFGEDGLPEGWRRGPLLELCELKRGYDLPLAQRRSGAIPIYSSSGATGDHDEAQAFAPGIVTGRYGTIGQVFFVETPYWPLNTTLYVRDFKGHEPRYVYYILRDLPYSKYVDKAAVPGVNRNDLHREPVVLASWQVEKAFAFLLAPVWKRQELNTRQEATLAGIRDLLLPRLVSGQLRTHDAERSVELSVA